MADEKKLEKVNDRLYHQPHEDGNPIKWEKRYSLISLSLTEVSPALVLSIDRPETAPRSLPQEAYSQELRWVIDGKAKLAGDDRIGILFNDGRVGTRNEQFTTAAIRLKAVPDSEKEKSFGVIWYDDAKYTRGQGPSIRMELYVPQTEFDAFRDEFVAGRLNRLELSIYIDAFQSEIDSLFIEPGMRQTLFIEEDSISTSAALFWARASRPVLAPSDAAPEEMVENPAALFTAKGFHEEKINFLGKWLMAVQRDFNAGISGLYRALLYVVMAYLLVKGLGWLFQR
jgi:hypothetical protein